LWTSGSSGYFTTCVELERAATIKLLENNPPPFSLLVMEHHSFFFLRKYQSLVTLLEKGSGGKSRQPLGVLI
jgi:ABC-type uncharacterized transport system ATPase subunit